MLILKALGWLLMAHFTRYSRYFVAQMWPSGMEVEASSSGVRYPLSVQFVSAGFEPAGAAIELKVFLTFGGTLPRFL